MYKLSWKFKRDLRSKRVKAVNKIRLPYEFGGVMISEEKYK